MCYKSGVVVVVLTFALALCGCQRGPQGTGNNPGGSAAGDQAATNAAEQAAIETVKKHGGLVKEEGGRVVEISLFMPSVTDETLKDLAPLTRTCTLKITNSKITGTGLKHLSGMTGLTEMDLAISPIDAAGLKEIAAFKQLKVLNLQGAKITGADLQALAPLTQLEELSVANNFSLGDAAGINIGAQFKQLKKLWIDNSDLGDAGFAAIASLPELQFLELHGTPQLTDNGLAALPKLKKLEELSLGRMCTDQSAKSIAACTSLRVLRLFHTDLTDAGLRQLGGLPLQELEIRRGPLGHITAGAVDEFKKTHPNCKVTGP
jgi:hypothetical protein